jgi:hypothetical protein
MTQSAALEEKTSWDRSLLRNIRCPFIRAAANDDKLEIVNGKNEQNKSILLATVASVREAGGGLADVLAFFARFNHTRGLDGVNNLLQQFNHDQFNMDQSTVQNRSDGTHSGSVNPIDGATGQLDPKVEIMIRGIAGGSVLTPETMAGVIVPANRADPDASVVDLAKSAGEWALMFCLLQDDHGNVPIDDLIALCRNMTIPPRGKINLAKSSTREWIQYTTVITAHIAHAKIVSGQPALANQVGNEMHKQWCAQNHQNNGPGCGCAVCTAGAGFWQNPGPSIRNAIATLGGGIGQWFRF